MERPRRLAATAVSSRKSALEELKALREKGGSTLGDDEGNVADAKATRKRRIDTFELKEDEQLYDVVDEREYKKTVERQRADADGFIVDDDGLGYGDGDDDVWGRDYEEDDDDLDEDGVRQRRRTGEIGWQCVFLWLAVQVVKSRT